MSHMDDLVIKKLNLKFYKAIVYFCVSKLDHPNLIV